jgi:hypothetical protein
MIVTSMQLTLSLRRDIAVLQKESSSLEGEQDVNISPVRSHGKRFPTPVLCAAVQTIERCREDTWSKATGANDT